MRGLTPWSPLRELEQMFDPDFHPHYPANYVPAVDVYEKGDNVMVETPLAGIDPEKVNITVQDNVLTIRGKLDERKEVNEKDYYRREIRHGECVRSVELPVQVKADQAAASSENGMLKVTIPKAEEAKPKSIKVKVDKK